MTLFTTAELAALLKVEERTITKWIREGKIEASRIGKGYRISDAAVKKFMGDDLLQAGRA